MNLDQNSSYDFTLLCLCIWRESRGEPFAGKQGVGWVIKNRVLHPGWWGNTWSGVILMPFQFSSFNHNDPNATKFPIESDPSWRDSIGAAMSVMEGGSDPTTGATSYFDASLNSNPPKWATDGSNVKTVSLGNLNFYRLNK